MHRAAAIDAPQTRSATARSYLVAQLESPLDRVARSFVERSTRAPSWSSKHANLRKMINQARRNDQRIGTIPAATHLALDVIERGQLTTIALVQDLRIEIRGVVDDGLALAEKVVGAVFRISRKLTQRLDDAASETLDGVEQLVSGAMRPEPVSPRPASA